MTTNCSRKECGKIAERYSLNSGYLCSRCFTELVESGDTTDVSTFMTSSPALDEVKREAAKARYSVIFKNMIHNGTNRS